MDYGTADDKDPFRRSKPGSLRLNDPGDPRRENETLKNINKPNERETASYMLEQDIPGGMNKSRDDDQGQGYWSHFRHKGFEDDFGPDEWAYFG